MPPLGPAEITAALACGRSGCPCARKRGKNRLVHCPAHDDGTPSFSVSESGGKVLLHCQAGCSQESVILALRDRGLWPGGNSEKDSSPKAPRSVIRYRICAPDGTLAAIHVRRDGPRSKTLSWELPNGSIGLGGVPVASLPLYGSERLRSLADGAAVVVVEGEKAAQALLDRGHAAVGTVTGAAGTPSLEALRPVVRLSPVLWPDNDDAGRAHMAHIAARLQEMGCPARLVDWPEAPPGGDAADAVAQGANLSALLQGARPVNLPEAENLATLLEDVGAFIRRYVVTGDAELTAITLWVTHTWTFEAAECTPYLHVTSPEKQSGKTRLLEVLNVLAGRPWFTSRVSAAVLVRKVARDAPTLLLDETDSAFKGEVEYAAALRGILNSGYRRGGAASLCVKAGKDYELVDLPTFCPKALAGVGELPDTIADRSIRIGLKRRAPSEVVERFRLRDAQKQARPLRERLERWATVAVVGLADARPSIPESLTDRAADVWEPLLAIADAAGGLWESWAREAAAALAGSAIEDGLSLGVRLLHDLREVLKGKTGPVPTCELLGALLAMEEAPWGDLRGKPLDPRRLSRLLRPYDIRPRLVRVGNAVSRGYHIGDFSDAFNRYCAHTPVTSVTSVTSVTDSKPERASEATGVTDVTDVTAPGGICAHQKLDGLPPASPFPWEEEEVECV